MKKLLILMLCFSIQSFVYSQVLTNLDEVSQLNENLIAIKKGNQWGFMNEKGLLVIDYRNDFVLNNDKTNPQPIFNDGRCLIRKLGANKYLYGYIDTKGKEVIPPQFLNASNFYNGKAIVITIIEEKVGFNEVLKKDVISKKLEEFIIDTRGKEVKYLENPRNYIPSQTTSKVPPKFHSKFISKNLVAVMKKDGKWDVYEF